MDTVVTYGILGWTWVFELGCNAFQLMEKTLSERHFSQAVLQKKGLRNFVVRTKLARVHFQAARTKFKAAGDSAKMSQQTMVCYDMRATVSFKSMCSSLLTVMKWSLLLHFAVFWAICTDTMVNDCHKPQMETLKLLACKVVLLSLWLNTFSLYQAMVCCHFWTTPKYSRSPTSRKEAKRKDHHTETISLRTFWITFSFF